ncbi:MAG: GNAT family N-acetyltransferase [Gammaproteobacteria bacterium]|nr:GNAT family N-acetyltransferase [Gammaproteobacteria bacterium]
MYLSYEKDNTLFSKCIDLMDSIFPGIKKIAMFGMEYNARWDKISLPFVIKDKDEVIAHLGIIPMDVMLNNKHQRIAALHGICVKESHRRKGLFDALMNESMSYIHQHFDASVLFTDNYTLYKKYPFKFHKEYNFLYKADKSKQTTSGLRSLDIHHPSDLNLIRELITNRLSLSNKFSVMDGFTLFILYNFNKKIFYSDEYDLIILYEIVSSNLHVKDILIKNQLPIEVIINLIPETFKQVIFEFIPDHFHITDLEPIEAYPECGIMVSENFLFNDDYFRFPEPYRC